MSWRKKIGGTVGGFGDSRFELPRLRDLRQRGVDIQPKTPANPHHLVGSGRWSADTKHGVTFFQKANRHGMEDLIERFVAGLLGPR